MPWGLQLLLFPRHSRLGQSFTGVWCRSLSSALWPRSLGVLVHLHRRHRRRSQRECLVNRRTGHPSRSPFTYTHTYRDPTATACLRKPSLAALPLSRGSCGRLLIHLTPFSRFSTWSAHCYIDVFATVHCKRHLYQHVCTRPHAHTHMYTTL